MTLLTQVESGCLNSATDSPYMGQMSGLAQQTFIPYKETFGLSFLQGRAIQTDTTAQIVALDNGKEVHYSHLILCTGTHGPFPGNCSAVHFYQKAVKQYEDVVKEVILIHSHEDLADSELLLSVRNQAKNILLEKGVELILGQKVSNLNELEFNVTQKGMVIKTNKKEQITIDLAICCTGNKINSGGSMAENGALKVNEHMQVEGLDNIYAVGDCSNISEPKMAYHAGLHAKVAATNIVNSLSGKSLTSYHTGPGRRLRGPEQDTEDDSVFEEPEILERERPRPQGSSPIEEFPAEKQVEEDIYDTQHKSGSNKKSRRVGFGSLFDKRATVKMSEGNKEGSPEMRIQRKMKKQQDRISWPKFPSFGKGRRAQFKRSHSTSEAEEHRKLEMSPPTSDTESPLKSPLKFPDGKDKEKKQKMHLNVTMKGYRSKSVEEPQRKEELITENLAAWENQQVDIVEEKYPEEATAKLVDIAHVVDDAENEVSSKIKQDHAFPSLSETELQHKVHFISLGNTLKTTDISITFAEGSADIVTLEEGKIERSEMKVNIRQKEKTDTGTGSQSGENRISDISASDHVVGSPVVILQPESERFQLDNDINTQEVNKDSSDKELVSINKEINIPKLDNSLELSSVGELEKSLKTCDEKQLKERNIFENESYGIRIRGPLADMATTKPHFSSTVDGFQFLLPESSGNKQESTIIDIQESSFAIPDISQAKFKTDSAISAVEMKDLEIRTSKLPTETNIDHLLADVDRRLESKFKLPNVDLSKLATQDPIKMTKIEQIKTYLPNREDIEIPGIESKESKLCLQTPVFKVPKIEKVPNITKEEKIRAQQTGEEFNVQDVKEAVSKFPAFKLPEGDVTGVLVQREVTIMEMKGDKTSITPRGSPCKISVTSADSSTTIYKSQIGKDKSSASDIADKDMGIKIPNVELHYNVEQSSIAVKKTDYTKPNIQDPKTKIDRMLITGDEKIGEVTFKLPKREDIEIPGMEAIKKSNTQKTKMKVDKDAENAAQTDKMSKKPKTKKYVDQIEQEKKSKKTKVSMQSFGITKPDIRFPDIGTDLPKKYIHKNDTGEKKMKKFEVDVPQTDTKLKDVSLAEATNLKQNTMETTSSRSDRKFGKKEAEIPIHEKSIMGKGLPEKKGPQSVNMDEKIQNIEIGGQGSKFKLPKFEISFPEVKVPKMHFSPSKKDTEFAIAEGNTDMPAAYSPDVEIPDAKTKIKEDTREVDSKGHEVKTKHSSFSFPKFGFSKSDTKITEADVHLQNTEGFLPEGNADMEVMNAEITLSIGDTSQENETKFGSPTKFKLPSISFPKFGAKAPKAAEDISDIDAQSKGPEISLSQAEVTVSDEPLSVYIKGPDVDKKIGKSLKPDTKVQDIQTEGQESKFKLPKFEISLPDVGGLKTDLSAGKTETDISAPEGKGEVHASDVEVPDLKTKMKSNISKVDSKGQEAEIKKPVFSFPRFGFSKSETKSPETDLSPAQVDVSLPGENVKLQGTTTDITFSMVDTEEEDKMNFGSPTKFKLPSISLPKFAAKATKDTVDISAVDDQIKENEIKGPELKVSVEPLSVHIKGPETDTNEKSVNIEMKAQDIQNEGQKSKFKLPKFGTSFPELKGPKIDLHVEKTDTDISLSVGKGDIHVHNVQVSDVKTEVLVDLPDSKGHEVKMDKPGFSFPKFGFSKSETKAPEGDVSLPQVGVSLPGEHVKMEEPNTEITLFMGDTVQEDETKFDSPKFKFPSISFPKFGAKSPKKAIAISTVDVQRKDLEISLPQREVVVSSEPLSVDTKPPGVDNEEKSLIVKLKAEDMKTEGQERKFKLPKSGISLPEVKGPKIDLQEVKTEMGISLPEGKGEVHALDVEMPDVKTEVKLDLPIVDSKGLKVEMKKPGFSLPKMGYSKSEKKESETDVTLPQVHVPSPGENVKIEGPNADIKIAMGDTGEEEKNKFGSSTKFKLPTISLPKFGSKATKEAVDISAVDVKTKGPEIHLPQAEVGVPVDPIAVEIKEPDKDNQGKSLSVDMKAQDVQIEGEESKFKLPKFGISFPEVKGPKIDLHGRKTETDISLPEGKGEIHGSYAEASDVNTKVKTDLIEVDLKSLEIFSHGSKTESGISLPCGKEKRNTPDVEVPDVKTEVKVDLPKVDSKGLKVEMKKPGFSLPRIGFSKSETKESETDASLIEVHVSLPGENVNIEGPNADINVAMGDTREQDKMKVVGEPKFKLTSISLQKFGSKATKEAVDSSVVDGQIKGPEISLPITEVKVSAECVSPDVKVPETKKDEKSVNTEMKGQDIPIEGHESMFKLPKFGISLPELKGPKMHLHAEKIDTDVSLPEGKREVHAANVQVPDVKTEVQVDLPKVDSKGLEVKMDKLGFSFPRFGFSKSETKAPEGDVSLPQVDVSLPVENVRMEEPHTEIKLSMGDTGQEIETKFGSPKFKLPSISLPKFGAKTTKKGTDISAVDVQMKGPEISLPQTEALVSSQPLSLDIKAPEVDKEQKSLNVDIKDKDIKTEWQESKFKLPKFGISLPEVKGPKTDLRAVKTEIDIVLLEGKGEVHALDVEVPDVKTEVKLDLPNVDSKGLKLEMKKPGFSLPKFGFSKSETKESEGNVSLPQVAVSLPGENVKIEEKNSDIKLAVRNTREDDKIKLGSSTKFKLPSISFPKFESKATKDSVDISAVDVKIKGPEISLQQAEVRMPADPIAVEIKEPDKDNQGKSLSVDMKVQDIQIEGQESKFKLPKFGISLPEERGPKIDFHERKTETDISVLEGKGGVYALDVEVPDVKTEVTLDLPKGDSKGLEVKMKEPGFSFAKFGFYPSEVKEPKIHSQSGKNETDSSLPEGKGEVHTSDVEMPDVKRKEVKGNLPEVDSKGLEVKIKKPVFSFPKFGFSKSETNAPKADVNLPNVDAPLQGENIKIEETHTDITIPMVDSGKEIEIQVSTKSLSTDIKGPEINKDGKSLDVEMKAQDIQIEEQERKFKLPKFGISIPDVKRPKTDLHASKTVTDISLPEGKGEVKTPGVEIAGVKTKMKVDLPEADSKDIEIKMKKPGFSFPKFGFSKSETNAPKADVNLPNVDAPLQGENIKIEETHTDITIPMVDSGKEDKIKFGSPTKIKLPSISLPKFGGKATKEAVDISAVDEQMKQTEIGFPEIEIQVSTKPLSTDIKGPEINKDGKSLDVEMKAQDIQIEEQEKKFKLPKFGISIPDVKRPKTDLHASKTVTDISLPEGKGEVKTPGVEIAGVKTKMKVDLPEADSKDIEIKMKKPGFSFPKFGFSKSESKAPEADVNLPQVDISLRGDNLKMEGPNAEVTLSTGDTNQEYENKFGSPTKFKQSTISLPKFGSKATKEAVEISAMDVQINDPVISLPQAEYTAIT
ncbi:hypothetical protein P4O66_002143 [Electrophorus voltai]|uniref:FAD/NAD(P)-binding domain-containing protein n=1 Tax=Electrophorus voltai TaxID=2609070 RepID=A0AAD8Z1U4_9TELE|nr:hypothetical protein P4O66_002143 [Electrophorus voltai]